VVGYDPDVVAISSQSAVRDATTTVGIDTPTRVYSGVNSRGRKSFVEPMGMAELARSDSGEFSAPMGAQNFEGDLLSPMGATGSHEVECEVRAAKGQHGQSGDRAVEDQHGQG